MKIIYHILYSIAAGLALTTLAACEDFLTEHPKGQLTTEGFFSSKEDLEASLTALYSTIAASQAANNCIGTNMLAGDDISTHPASNKQPLREYDQYDVKDNNSWMSTMWEHRFKVIKAANFIINNAERTPGVSEEELNAALGQAHYWRAYSYFYLVTTWGPVPVMLEEENLSSVVCRKLNLSPNQIDLSDWEEMLDRARNCENTVRIALVGKYVQLHDAYLSVAEALAHAGFENGAKVEIEWVDSEVLNAENTPRILNGVQGILVPGGFGGRGIEGKIESAKYARENKIPYLGICLGMQIAVIEFAKNVLGIPDADSSEFSPAGGHNVIDIMPDQRGVKKGGTMRLGAYPCKVKEGTRLYGAYQRPLIFERHRHRYEFNNDYRERFERAGMSLSGLSPSGELVEAVELPDHPFYVGVQFHPEFKSRPNQAHPLFREFVGAALGQIKKDR